jgi:hypothetical protein
MLKKNIVFSCYPEIKENFSSMPVKKEIIEKEPEVREVDVNNITINDIRYYLRKLFELYKNTYKTGDEILTNYIRGCILEAINIKVNLDASKINVPIESKSVKVGNIIATSDDKIREETEKLEKLEKERKLGNKAINSVIIKINKDKNELINIQKSIIKTINESILNETTNKVNALRILKLARIGILRKNAGSLKKMVNNLGNNLLRKMKENPTGESADSIFNRFYKENEDDLERLEINKENVLVSIDAVTNNTLSLAHQDNNFCKNLTSDYPKEDIESGKFNILENFFKCYIDLEVGSKVSFGLVGLNVNESFFDMFTNAIDNWLPPPTEEKKLLPQSQEAIKINLDKINKLDENAPKLFCFKTNDHFTCYTEVTVIENGKTSILR